MYKNTVTVFNRKPGDRGKGATWYPTIVEGCNLNVDRATILAKYGAESKDSAYMGIHYQKKDGAITIAGKRLLEPKEWDGSEDSITFGPTGDFFWEGEWDGGIVTDSDDRWTDEGFYSYMNRTKDNVFTISSAARHSVIPLVEVWGK